MATVYFDIKKAEFYTETRPLYPFDFSAVGSTVRTRLETFIHDVEPFHIGTIGDVLTFNLTNENKNVIKLSSAPFEVSPDIDDSSIYHIKYGYVGMFPRNVLNSARLFRTSIYELSQLAKLKKVFQQSDNINVISTKADAIQVLDITYKNDYNSFAAIVEFRLQKL